MAKAKSKLSIPDYITSRRADSPYHFNGESHSAADRLARIEESLGQIQDVLHTQLQRIADMQVIIDRLVTRPPTSRD